MEDGNKTLFVSQPETPGAASYETPVGGYRTGEQLVQIVARNAPIIMFMVDRVGVIQLSIGKPIESLKDVRPESTVGLSIYEVYKENRQVIDDFERALNGQSFSDIITLGALTFETHFAPLIDDNGEIIGVVGIANDITERKRAEEALAQSEALFKILFERAGVGIVLEDVNGMIFRFNPYFERMLGYSAEELQRFNYNHITHPQDQAISRFLYGELVDGKREHYFVEKRYICKDGSTVWGRMTATRITGPDGRTQFVIGMIEDITARKQMEAELAEVRRRLTSSRETERLGLAQELHDGPLQDIIGLTFQAQTLEHALADEQDLEVLRSMQETLQELTFKLRAIAVELRPPALAPFGLEKAIQSHAENFQKLHPDILVTLKLTRDAQLLSEEIRLTLFRIYQESLNNILKHAHARNIWVRFFLDDEQAVLEVQDDGSGFEIPRRWVSMARKGHLGLVGAYERAESIGGRLEIETEQGKGTLIRAIVPMNGNSAV